MRKLYTSSEPANRQEVLYPTVGQIYYLEDGSAITYSTPMQEQAQQSNAAGATDETSDKYARFVADGVPDPVTGVQKFREVGVTERLAEIERRIGIA